NQPPSHIKRNLDSKLTYNPSMKKLFLLLLLSLGLTSISYAGIEGWPDSSVCMWLKSNSGASVPLKEAKKRGISCKDGVATKISPTTVSTKSISVTTSSTSSSASSTPKISNKKVATLIKTTDPNALCSNGEQATYTVKRGSTNKWAVIMPGGGIAGNADTYRNRHDGLKGNDVLHNFDAEGHIEKDLSDRGYNMVWIPYCSNLAYQGNHDVMIDGKKVPFRGRAIVKD
ncbi:uncharacterized protein METZ01_LOCUS515987, partial [marine metagenome]